MIDDLTPIEESILWVAHDGHVFGLHPDLQKTGFSLAQRGYLRLMGDDENGSVWVATEVGQTLGGAIADKMHDIIMEKYAKDKS